MELGHAISLWTGMGGTQALALCIPGAERVSIARLAVQAHAEADVFQPREGFLHGELLRVPPGVGEGHDLVGIGGRIAQARWLHHCLAKLLDVVRHLFGAEGMPERNQRVVVIRTQRRRAVDMHLPSRNGRVLR